MPGRVGLERTPFIGRRAERAALHDRLAEGERLVTVLGPPGVGKTRLASQLLREQEPAWSDAGGARFCDLTAARTPCDVLFAVAATLGVEAGRESVTSGAERIGDALASLGPVLLVLDNCEHVVPFAGLILTRWIERAPDARFLATSQLRLGVDGEVVFELEPLPREDAIELYEDRARRGGAAAFERDAVGSLVDRLDRLPLAIELAAARARVLAPAEFLGRLDKRFELLRGVRNGKPSSLAEAIGRSWDALSPAEAAALAQVSVFSGGFTLAAAEAVIELPDDAPALLDVLEALRDRSMLKLQGGTPPRFSLYESVRDYAALKLDESGGTSAAARRHGEYFARLAPSGPDDAQGSQELEQLAAEADNLLVAHRRHAATDPRLAAHAALAVFPVFALRGLPESSSSLVESLVGVARRTGDDVLVARALRARSVVAGRRGRLDLAAADLEEALALAADAPHVEAQLFALIGRVHALNGDFAAARRSLESARTRVGDAPATFLHGYVAHVRGMVEEAAGDLDSAATCFETAFRAFDRSGATRFRGLAWLNAGVVREGQGRLEDARSLYESALSTFTALRDRAGEADALVNLGGLHLALGLLDEAQQLLDRGLSLQRALGNRRFEILALANLGVLSLLRGEAPQARALLESAIVICRAIEERQFRALILPFFAAAEAQLGLRDEARADFAEARRMLGGDAAPTVDVLEGFLDLAAAREGGEARGLHVGRAVARLQNPPPEGRRRGDWLLALRVLRAAINVGSGPSAQSCAPDAALRVADDATWFETPGGTRVDLRNRPTLRRVLATLASTRLLAPGSGTQTADLFAAGWPGEKAQPGAAAARVYVAVGTLRSLGLDGILLRTEQGYMLDPELPLQRLPS